MGLVFAVIYCVINTFYRVGGEVFHLLDLREVFSLAFTYTMHYTVSTFVD